MLRIRMKVRRSLTLLMSALFLFSSFFSGFPVNAEAAQEIVIDNGDTGYFESGTWTSTGNVLGYNNSDTRFSYTPGAYAQWSVTPAAGVYEVFIYKLVHTSCDTAARIEVGQGSQVKSTVNMNYTQGTSGWVSLGYYAFDGTSAAWVKNFRSGAASRADAVKFVLSDAAQQPQPVIVDNDSPYYSENGTWANSGLPGYNGTPTRYGYSLGASATWQPPLSAGMYEVSIYKVANTSSDTNAKIDIAHADGVDTVYLNYAQGSSGWVLLGIYRFSEGNEGYVRNTRNTNDNIRADAVKFQQVIDPAVATLKAPSVLVDVDVDTPVVLTFNRDMDVSTMNLDTIRLTQTTSGAAIDATCTVSDNGRTFTIIPEQNLKYLASYSLTISQEVKDTDGKPVSGTKNWTFTTRTDANSKYIVLDPEDFLFNKGTWTMENAPDAFGGRYLISKKDELPGSSISAFTDIITDAAGDYRIFVHCKDYTTSLPGTRTFKISVNNVLQDEIFGDHGIHGWSWEDGGVVQLQEGDNILELVDISAFYARVDAILITNQLDCTPPDRYTDLEKISLQNTGMQQKLAFPQWALTDAQPVNELSIGNDNVHIEFYSTPAADGRQVIQKRTSIKSGNDWLPVEDRTDPFGYLLMYSENTPVGTIDYDNFSYLKINKFNRKFDWMIPEAIEQIDSSKIKLTAENSYARLTAVWEIAENVQEPTVTLTLEAKQQGAYSVGMFTGKEKSLEEIDSLLLPFQLTSKELPGEFYVVPEWLASTPVSQMTLEQPDGSEITYGVAVDPSSIPDRWARTDNSKFGISIKGLQGGVQPAAFAPLYGTADSVLQQGQTYVFAYRPVIWRGEWFESYEHVVGDIYRFADDRKNYYSSFTDTIFNTQDLAMDDNRGGWDAVAKGHYNMEGKNTISMASPLTYIQSYLLTEDAEIYHKRTIPAIEALLTRGGLHYTTVGDDDPGGLLAHLGIKGVSPVGSPVNGYGNNTIGGAYVMTRGLTSVLKDVGIDAGIRNEESYIHVPEWHQNLALYKYTGNTSYLDLAKTQADDYLSNIVYKVSYTAPADTNMNMTDVPYWSGLVDLYEVTGDEKYIQGAAYAAKRWVVSLWTQPVVNDGQKTIAADDVRNQRLYPDGWNGFWKGAEHERVGYPEGLSDIQDETVPNWVVSRLGLGIEAKQTFVLNDAANIQISPWAPDLIRLAQYTGDDIFETYARNAMIGRFSNYPGYYLNQNSVQQMKPDYPYNGPDQTGIYYHHIPVQLSLDVDFLITQIWKWSDGKINFPSVREQGYAFFNNRHYGFDAGSMFDETDMWLWLKKGLVTVDNMQIDWLGARKEGRFAVALINEDTAEQTVTVSLGEDVTGGENYNGTATLYDAAGNKSSVQVVDSMITLTIPGHGLAAVALDSDFVEQPAFADVPAEEIFNSPDDGSVVTTGPTAEFGKGMVIQLDPDSYNAYVYTTFMPEKTEKAVLYWHTGDGNWQQQENSTYPYEFSVKVDDMSKTFHYYVKVLDKDGNWLVSNEAELKPKVYLKEAVINADKQFLNVGEASALTGSAIMSDLEPADMSNAVVTFESSDPSVIEVTSGSAVAVNYGSAKVKAVVVVDGIRRESEEITITVDPVPLVAELIKKIEDLYLEQGLTNSLTSKLDNIRKSILKDKESAVNQIEAFKNEVSAQRGKKLTDAQADELISDAERILN